MEKQLPRKPATFETVWASLQELAEMQKETERVVKETSQQMKDTDRRMKDTDRLVKETDRLVKETSQQMKETSQQMKETSQQMKETSQQMKETSQQMKETSQQMKETDRRLDKMTRDSDRQMKETDRRLDKMTRDSDRQMKEADQRLDKSLNRMQGRFDNRWGDFMESLVEGDLVALLQRRDILVDRIHPRPYGKRNGEDFEFDIVAINGVEVVVVEVKTTLCAADIKHFLKKLLKYTYYEPEHRGKTIYGAMAYLKTSKAAKTHAERQGLFVIRATGDSASIVNEEGFVPRVFE